MTLAQRDVIVSPPGLQIWCTDCTYRRYVFTQEVSGLESSEQVTAIRDNTKKSSNHTRAGSYR
jgi:hypothetical protein